MIKNVIKVFTSNMLVTLLSIINGLFFPIIMSIDGYAHYQLFLLYSSYFNFCHLGLASGMYINYAGKRMDSIDKKQYKSEILLLLEILLFFFLICILSTLLYKDKLWFLAVITMFPLCIVASFRALYQAWNRFTAFSIINVIPNLFTTISIIISYIFYKKINKDLPIYAYIIIYSMLTVWLLVETYIFTKGVHSNKIFSSINCATLCNGFLVHLGSYISLIFHSVDKQFVRFFYTTEDFAMYAFALSAFNLILVLINSFTQPLYLSLVLNDQKKDSNKRINLLKDILFIFGVLCTSSYFVFAIIISNYIVKYKNSLNIMAVYLGVLPGIAVINVLYSNLYKVKQLLKRYVVVLLEITAGVIILNFISIIFRIGSIGIAYATTISYYIWLIYSKRDLEEVSFRSRDVVFLLGYGIIYISSVKLNNSLDGLFIYILMITIWSIMIYWHSLKNILTIITSSKMKDH